MRAIKYPFTLDAFGVLHTSSIDSKVYLDKLLTLLSTQVGQRPMLPEYGTDLGYALFENENNFEAAVKTAVTSAVSKWLPQLRIDSISIESFDDSGYATVRIIVELPNSRVDSITISTAVFGSTGSIGNV